MIWNTTPVAHVVEVDGMMEREISAFSATAQDAVSADVN